MSRPRRPYGSGSLLEVHGSWYGQWRVRGRLVKRKLGPKRSPGSADGLTRAQAERRLRQMLEETRGVATSQRVSFPALAERYLSHLEHVMERKPTTLEDYRCMLRRHMEPFFGARAIDGITVGDVEQYLVSKKTSGLATKTVLNHLTFLHGLFSFGIKRGWMVVNPVDAVDRPRPQTNRDLRFLSLDELHQLLSFVPDDPLGSVERPLYTVASMSGLRQGELLALTWRDVDFDAGLIRVRRSITRGRTGQPKSRRGVRAVPMAPRARTELEELAGRTAFAAPSCLVFGHPHKGTHLDPARLRKRLRAACAAAGVRSIRFHDLRHTYGTLMAGAGTPLRMLQEWMGHQDYKTTLIYADYAADPGQAVALTSRAFGI